MFLRKTQRKKDGKTHEYWSVVENKRVAGGRDHALVFETGILGVPGAKVNGCDFLHLNDDGLIDEFMVMVRPLSGATALSEAMGAQFEWIQQEAVELANQFANTSTV